MKKKRTKEEKARLLADLRSGKVGMEDDPAEEAALNEAFERGEFKPIYDARKKQLMKDAAETLASADFMSERVQPEIQDRPALDLATEEQEPGLARQVDEYCDHLQKNKKSLEGFNKLSEEEWPK